MISKGSCSCWFGDVFNLSGFLKGEMFNIVFSSFRMLTFSPSLVLDPCPSTVVFLLSSLVLLAFRKGEPALEHIWEEVSSMSLWERSRCASMKEDLKVSLLERRAELTLWFSPICLNFKGVLSTSSIWILMLSSFSSISSRLLCVWRHWSLVLWLVLFATMEFLFFLKTLSLCWTQAALIIACSSSPRSATESLD